MRRPPSRRNVDLVDGRLYRGLQSMLPGTMGGRVANAGGVLVDASNQVPSLAVGDSTGVGAWISYYEELSVDPSQTTHYLKYIPIEKTLLLFLNGVLLDEATDFTCDYTTGLVTITETVATGDVAAAQYWYSDKASGLITGVSFSQGQSGDFRIWTWVDGGATSQALATGGSGGGTMKLAKSGNVYTGSLGGTTVVSWTDTSGIAQWGADVGVILGPLSTSVVDNFVATGAGFSDNFNRTDGPLENDWMTGALGSNSGPLISGNTIPNNVPAGTDQACWFFRYLDDVPTDVRIDLSGAPDPSGGFLHVFCGVSGVSLIE